MSSSSDGAPGAGNISTKPHNRLKVIAGGARGISLKSAYPAPRRGAQVVLVYSVDRKHPVEKQFHELPVDKEKVKEIRRRLADGSLRINADKIAEKLIEQDSLNG